MTPQKTILGLAAAAAVLVPATAAQAAGTLSHQGDALDRAGRGGGTGGIRRKR